MTRTGPRRRPLPLLASLAALAAVACAEPAAPGLCPADGDRTGPTPHAWTLDGDDLVWTAEASPHVVTGVLSVPAGETLRIEPCAEVRFEADAGLEATLPGSRLEILGEPGAEVTLSGQDGARWADLHVAAPASAELRHARLRGGGADPTHGHPTLLVRGTGDIPTARPVLVDTVEVTDSWGPGLVVEQVAGFAEGSAGLVVRGAGQGGAGVPLVVGEHTLTTLPDGTYTGNADDVILVREESAGGHEGFQEDATLRALGVPYRTAPDSFLRVGTSGDRVGRTTLTFEAGVEVQFAAGTGVVVDDGLRPDTSFGVLRLLGTAEAPVRLTSAAPTPAPGDWRGLVFQARVAPETRLEHVELAHTGAWCGCSLLSCSDVAFYEAAIVLLQPPEHAFLTDSTLRDGAGHGIVRSWDGPPGPDLTASNTFTDLGGCDQTLPRAEDGTCPDDTLSPCE